MAGMYACDPLGEPPAPAGDGAVSGGLYITLSQIKKFMRTGPLKKGSI